MASGAIEFNKGVKSKDLIFEALPKDDKNEETRQENPPAAKKVAGYEYMQNLKHLINK